MIKFLKKLHDAKWWLYHRFHPKHRYNLVHTGLKPGYYDKDWLMFNACFNLLKDYVEGEMSWMALICSDDERAKIPWWMSMNRYHKKHCKRLALGYLTYWEKVSEEEADRVWCMTPEALYDTRREDKEILDLYLWWIETRPNRPDPYDGCYESKPGYVKAIVPNEKLEEAFNQEMAYDKEDDEMLVRLVNIRRRLWT